MTLEEYIKRYDDRAKSIRNAIVEKKESQEVVELLKELQRWREFGGRIANVCASYITEEQKEKLLEIMEVNADE